MHKQNKIWWQRQGIALVFVLGVALLASVVFATIFSLLQQGASTSRSFGQRITASAWNDRILTRIAAVVAAQPWEDRFYMKLIDPKEQLYTFNVSKFPFEDLADDCNEGQVSFDGAIMDVPNERKYRVKLVVNCKNPETTYSTFTEVHYSPGLLDLANRGVKQITMNLAPGDIDLSRNAFATSISRISGIAKDVGQTTPVPVASTGASQKITSKLAAAPVKVPTENKISSFPEEFVKLTEFMDFPDRDFLVRILKARIEFQSIVPNSKQFFSQILLPTGETMREWLKDYSPLTGIKFSAEQKNFYEWHWDYRTAFAVFSHYNCEFPRQPSDDRYGMILQKAILTFLADPIYLEHLTDPGYTKYLQGICDSITQNQQTKMSEKYSQTKGIPFNLKSKYVDLSGDKITVSNLELLRLVEILRYLVNSERLTWFARNP